MRHCWPLDERLPHGSASLNWMTTMLGWQEGGRSLRQQRTADGRHAKRRIRVADLGCRSPMASQVEPQLQIQPRGLAQRG